MRKLKNCCLEFKIKWLNSMAKYIEDEVHIESPMDLEAELCKYN